LEHPDDNGRENPHVRDDREESAQAHAGPFQQSQFCRSGDGLICEVIQRLGRQQKHILKGPYGKTVGPLQTSKECRGVYLEPRIGALKTLLHRPLQTPLNKSLRQSDPRISRLRLHPLYRTPRLRAASKASEWCSIGPVEPEALKGKF